MYKCCKRKHKNNTAYCIISFIKYDSLSMKAQYKSKVPIY